MTIHRHQYITVIILGAFFYAARYLFDIYFEMILEVGNVVIGAGVVFLIIVFPILLVLSFFSL